MIAATHECSRVIGNHSKMTSSASLRDWIAGMARAQWPLWLAGGLVVLAALGGEPARVALRYDRAGIAAGEWWRLISGHFVHLGPSHTALNLAGLVLVAALFPREFRARQWSVLLVAALATISAGLLLLRPGLAWYVGLSGVLHGLFFAGALRWVSRREWEGYVLGGFLMGKLAWEQYAGALPLSVSTSGGPVIVDAHLYGAVAGAAAGAAMLRDWASQRR